MKHTFFCILSGFFFFHEEIQFVTFPSGEAQFSIKDSQFYAIKILNSLKRLKEHFFLFVLYIMGQLIIFYKYILHQMFWDLLK